jgi:hypothetical protein
MPRQVPDPELGHEVGGLVDRFENPEDQDRDNDRKRYPQGNNQGGIHDFAECFIASVHQPHLINNSIRAG